MPVSTFYLFYLQIKKKGEERCDRMQVDPGPILKSIDPSREYAKSKLMLILPQLNKNRDKETRPSPRSRKCNRMNN